MQPAVETEFLELLEQHRTILFKIANLYCRNRADFADVVQEITLQAWRAFNRYDSSRPFSTWLYRVGLNVAISFYRTESRRSRFIVPADESILEIAGPPSDAAAFRRVTSALASTGSNTNCGKSGPICRTRNTRMDFDALKRVWVDCDKRLAAGMHLNARQVRSIVAHDDDATIVRSNVTNTVQAVARTHGEELARLTINLKCFAMIVGPLPECACRRAGEVADGSRHVRGQTDGGVPRSEQHVDHGRRPCA
jgi:RNA polymerase sigma factor (sigma-70 family)